MKNIFTLLIPLLFGLVAGANNRTYVGSTPAHYLIRNFLQISLIDSIDFIRWKLEIGAERFSLQCRYGLAKPGTPGFTNEQSVAFEGQFTRSGHRYVLKHRSEEMPILEVNANVLHFLDRDNRLLAGNGGYSYALNNTQPAEADEINIRPAQTGFSSPLVFEGRTPCRELSILLGLQKSDACNKMKWYFLLYSDPITREPTYFLMGGIGHRKETMERGRWQIFREPNGRTMYRLYADQWSHPLNLLRGDANILFFTDANGHLLVGNEDFSFTLNRREEEYPPAKQ